MGWSGGTELFDGALDIFLPYIHDDTAQELSLVRKWYDVFQDTDWDTDHDSQYYQRFILDFLLEDDMIDQEEYDELKL